MATLKVTITEELTINSIDRGSSRVHDVLSAFYFVRTLDLEVGRDVFLSAHSSRETYDLRVIVHSREQVETALGSFDCFVIQPVMVGEGEMVGVSVMDGVSLGTGEAVNGTGACPNTAAKSARACASSGAAPAAR